MRREKENSPCILHLHFIDDECTSCQNKISPTKKNRRGLCAAPGRMRPIFPNSIERHPGICHGETKFYLSKQAAPFIGDIQIGHGDDALS